MGTHALSVNDVILAVGHSARDTFKMLYDLLMSNHVIKTLHLILFHPYEINPLPYVCFVSLVRASSTATFI